MKVPLTIVLDTNVLSEVTKPTPSQRVGFWLAAQDGTRVFTTAITLAEMLRGVGAMPRGRRRTELAEIIDAIFRKSFSDRILAFDQSAARAYARIIEDRSRAGRPISQSDAMIAAICETTGATLATRNIRDFLGCGIALINPWD